MDPNLERRLYPRLPDLDLIEAGKISAGKQKANLDSANNCLHVTNRTSPLGNSQNCSNRELIWIGIWATKISAKVPETKGYGWRKLLAKKFIYRERK
jgi:hypothetical protein